MFSTHLQFVTCTPQILRSLPFLANVEDELFDEIVAAGQLVTYRDGDEIWEPPPDADDQATCVLCSINSLYLLMLLFVIPGLHRINLTESKTQTVSL